MNANDLNKRFKKFSEAKMSDILAKGDREGIKAIAKIVKELKDAGKSDKEIIGDKKLKSSAPASMIKDLIDGKSEEEVFKGIQANLPKHLKEELDPKAMYDKLMGHFKRNKPGRHSGHAGEYFNALKKVKADSMTDKDIAMVKELWSMYGEKLSEAKKSNPLASFEAGGNDMWFDLLSFHGVEDMDNVKQRTKARKSIQDDLEYAQGVIEMMMKKVKGL